MTDKELKSLSRIQMLEILLQQEKEIGRLSDELSKPREDNDTKMLNDTTLLDGIKEATQKMEATQKAAEKAAEDYLSKIASLESERAKASQVSQVIVVDSDVAERTKAAETYYQGIVEKTREALNDMDTMLTWLSQLAASMHEEYRHMIETGSLGEIVADMDFDDEQNL